MIENAALLQTNYLLSKPESVRKEIGQYFTNSTVASYMASMIKSVDTEVVKILDAGAGAGILTISAALQCFSLGHKKVHAVLYELDSGAIPHLKANMNELVKQFDMSDGEFTYEIRNKDFVLNRPDKKKQKFHISLINPPYFKYNSKNSPYAKATSDLFKGDPNIYASFMAIVSACMISKGQMIAIVPRSFTNGLYFKGFRKYLNETMSLDRIHIFEHRNKIFKNSKVLQENVIFSYSKQKQIGKIKVHASRNQDDLDRTTTNSYPFKLIIDNSNDLENLRIPETSEDAKILDIVENWPSTFIKNGYFISTGPVVEHRTREFISKADDIEDSTALIRMHNVKAFRTVWTGSHKKDVRFKFLDGYHKHVTKSIPYILLKRFSSKDEKRRLVAGVYDPRNFRESKIAFENHLNFIGKLDKQLDINEAFGLAALLNSTFMDKYFRCLSGNTQVNATEIRLLKMPTKDIVKKIGHSFQEVKQPDQLSVDSIVNFHLNLKEFISA